MTMSTMGHLQHFVTTADYSTDALLELLAVAGRIKADPRSYTSALSGQSLALLFQKPSMRTRVSFDIGMYQLGGHCVTVHRQDVQLGVREELRDVARAVSRYVQGIVLRTFDHDHVLQFARYATVPVINGLSDYLHPCQALSDMLTIRERFGRLDGIRMAYIGDGNNVLHSLLLASAQLGVQVRYATPARHAPDPAVVAMAAALASSAAARPEAVTTPMAAVQGADVVYTDVWASMGREAEQAERLRAFQGYTINTALLAEAADRAVVMHCLPAHRGEEIDDAVIEGERSVVFDQAENRLHAQKAILVHLLGAL